MKKINLVTYFQHTLVGDSLAEAIKIIDQSYQVTCITNIQSLKRIVKTKNDSIVLIDHDTVILNGGESEFLKKLSGNMQMTQFICFINKPNLQLAKNLLKAGFSGILTPTSSLNETFKAISQVVTGKKYVAEEFRTLLIHKFIVENESEPLKLSLRETNVVSLLKQGLNSQQIADQLSIKLKTVQVHRYNILRKTKSRNTANLIDKYSTFF